MDFLIDIFGERAFGLVLVFLFYPLPPFVLSFVLYKIYNRLGCTRSIAIVSSVVIALLAWCVVLLLVRMYLENDPTLAC